MLPQASPHTPVMLVLSNLAFLLNSWSLSCSLRETGGIITAHLFDENAWVTRL